jgi:hypothetical protein
MNYVHIRNLQKYHPGYKDRTLQWAKIYFKVAQGDPDCEMITNEIDWARLIKFILLELEAQKPIPLDEGYLIKKGFNLKKRPISLTIDMLHNFLEVIHSESEIRVLDKDKDKDKDKNKIYVDWEQSTFTKWNSFCDKYPSLVKIKEISEKRRQHLKKQFGRESFKNFDKILEAIEQQPFLLNGNNNDKHQNWRISFDWLIENDNNYLKVLEGKYKEIPKKTDMIKLNRPLI